MNSSSGLHREHKLLKKPVKEETKVEKALGTLIFNGLWLAERLSSMIAMGGQF